MLSSLKFEKVLQNLPPSFCLKSSFKIIVFSYAMNYATCVWYKTYKTLKRKTTLEHFFS